LAKHTLLLLRDHELRSRMSLTARRRHAERFTQAHGDAALAVWLRQLAEAR